MNKISIKKLDGIGRVTIPYKFREILGFEINGAVKLELDEENKRLIITEDNTETLQKIEETKKENLEFVYGLAKSYGIIPDDIKENMEEWGF